MLEKKRTISDFLLKNETSESKSENVMRQVYRTCEGLKNEEVSLKKLGLKAYRLIGL